MKKPPAPRLVTVAIFTTITVVFWIFFSVYTVLTKDADIKVPPELLEPIDPTLDIESLQTISERVHFEESDVVSPIITVSTSTPEPSPTSEEIPEPTVSPIEATPTENPTEATPTESII